MAEETPVENLVEEKPAEERRCRACRAKLGDKHIQWCGTCKSPQVDEVTCRVCRQFIPPGAKRCNACQTYQGQWWRVTVSTLVLSLLISLLSVLKPALEQVQGFLNRHSKTTITFLSATDTVITVRAVNTGGSRSVVRGCRIRFGALPVSDADLELFRTEAAAPQNWVPANGELTINYTVAGLESSVARDTLVEQLATAAAPVIEVDVEESAGPKTRTVRVAANAVAEFILGKV
jgi:hypothetical protein